MRLRLSLSNSENRNASSAFRAALLDLYSLNLESRVLVCDFAVAIIMVRVNAWGFVLFVDEDWAREKKRGHDGRVLVSAILSNSLDIEPIRI